MLLLCAVVMVGCGAHHANPVANVPPPPEADSSASTGNVPAASSPVVEPGAVVPPTAKVIYTETGWASWYGPSYNKRKAANGEVYDMNGMTAAHRTLPLNSIARVTNLKTGHSELLRITDRGPFVNDRIIDLSLAAAREVDSIDAGVVPVRVEVLGGVDPTVGSFTVQVGAFRDRGNAERLRDRLSSSYSPIFIQQYDSPDGVFYRVRVGRISGEDAAHQFGEQLRDRQGFTPLVTRLDEGLPAGGNR